MIWGGKNLAGCVAELFGPAASPDPPVNGSRCSETAALCPIAPGRYFVDLEAISPTRRAGRFCAPDKGHKALCPLSR